MKNEKPVGNTKAARGGDTSRSSSQGRKQSSGGQVKNTRKGNPQIDTNSKAEVSEQRSRNNPEPRKS